MKKRPTAVGGVVASGGVANERIVTIGQIATPGNVVLERKNAVGRVIVSGRIVEERLKTRGSIAAANGVVI